MSRVGTLLCAVLSLLATLPCCRFDPSGVGPTRSDAHPNDGPLDRAADRPDLPASDRQLDLPPDLSVDGPAPDLFVADQFVPPCSPACTGGTPHCCDKGDGYKCHSNTDLCRCPVGFDPCSGGTPICCDKGQGEGRRCYSSSADCTCSLSDNPCTGGTPVCCKKWDPVAKCHKDSAECVCSATFNPCTGGTPYCCDKDDGAGLRCHPDPQDCLCSAAQNVCLGSTSPICCEKWDGFMRCYDDAEECKCSAGYDPCTSPYDTCCDKGGGERCYFNAGGCI
jgi:hypothetical protein